MVFELIARAVCSLVKCLLPPSTKCNVWTQMQRPISRYPKLCWPLCAECHWFSIVNNVSPGKAFCWLLPLPGVWWPTVLIKLWLSAALNRPLTSLPWPLSVVNFGLPGEIKKVLNSLRWIMYFVSSASVCLVITYCSCWAWVGAFFLTYLQLL